MSMRKIRKLFWKFCDSEICVKISRKKITERISMSYRCRNGQEFRWVSMEIIKSTEYAKDNEVVVLYLRGYQYRLSETAGYGSEQEQRVLSVW